ncbi:MAG: hypothetical protein KDN19_16455, partial [Verrucomicrobiae bacterium]|nr:hypothetical protein [Verrucomicrobiae bacterium]
YSAVALKDPGSLTNADVREDLTLLANEALETLIHAPRHLPPSGTSSSTTFSRQPDVSPWWPEEYLLWRTLEEGDRESAEALIEKIRGGNSREMTDSAKTFFDLAWGDSEQFTRAANTYLSDSNVSQHGSVTYVSFETMAGTDKLMEIWKARRKSDLKDFDFEAMTLDLAKSPLALGPLMATKYLEYLVAEEADEARGLAYLEKLTTVMLGDRDEWDRFAPPSENNYQNAASNPRHAAYADLVRHACWDQRLAFLVAGFLKQNGLDSNQQITNNTLLAYLATPRLASEPELAARIFSHAPFFGDAENFLAITTQNGTALGECLKAIGNSAPSKTAVRDAAGKADTFGAGLVVASLSENPKLTVAEFLGQHRGEIESKMSESARMDLATFVGGVYDQGGADYSAVSEDAQAVLKSLGMERAKSQRELAEEFLALENLPDEFNDVDDVSRKLGPMMVPLWAVEDWDLAAKLYWHGVNLIDRKIARGQWSEYAYTGWNTATRLLIELVTDTPGGGLDRIAFHERIVRQEKENKLVPNCGGLNFGPDIRDAFEQAGGYAGRDEALDAIAQKLHEQCGEGSLFAMGFHFMEFAFTQPFDRIPDLIEWADDRAASDRPWAAMAREFAMGARLGLQSHKNAAIQKIWPRVPDIESWQPHYRQLLENEELPISWRLGMIFELCDSDPYRKLEPETVLLCARLLADGLLAEAPLHHWTAFYVGTPFNRLEKTAEWEEIARRLHEGWVLVNRHNHRPYRQGPAFWPPTESMLAMLNIQLRRGDSEAVKEFFSDRFTYDRLDDETRTFFTLVDNGSYELAREIIEKQFEWYDITDDYIAGNRFEARYSQTLHERLPEFLETIENPAMRYLAELLIVGALDPKPEDKEADATYPLRGPRIADSAKRFATVDFGTSGRGSLLRDKSLQQIAAIDGPAGTIWNQWKQWYRPEKCRALCELDNYKKIEHGSRPLAAFAALQLREGDLSVVNDMIQAANESSNQDYYRREVLEHFSARLIDSLIFRKPNAKPEEFAAYSEALGKLITETKNEIFQHSNLDMLVSAHLVATVLAGREAELPAWREQLDENRAKRRSDAVKSDQNTFLRILVQTLKVKVPNEAVRATPEERLRTLLTVFADPGIRQAFGMPRDLYQRLIEQELLLPEQLLEDDGEKLAEQNPRGGWAAVEIALTHWRKRDFDQAMAWCDRAQEDCGDPEKALERFARVSLKRVDILLAAEKNKEALAALDVLGKTIDLTRLPTGLQKTIERLREQAS